MKLREVDTTNGAEKTVVPVLHTIISKATSRLEDSPRATAKLRLTF
jgi:hypothetical protein